MSLHLFRKKRCILTKYDFDRVIDRHGTFSTQWDYIADRFGRNDILPFSISDTDFPVPVEVQDALQKRFAHPIYGYTRWNHETYKDSIVHWFERDGHTKVDSGLKSIFETDFKRHSEPRLPSTAQINH